MASGTLYSAGSRLPFRSLIETWENHIDYWPQTPQADGEQLILLLIAAKYASNKKLFAPLSSYEFQDELRG